jgi:hypothetical protein
MGRLREWFAAEDTNAAKVSSGGVSGNERYE